MIRWALEKIGKKIGTWLAGNVPERGIDPPSWGDAQDLTPTATETPRAKLSERAKAMRAEAMVPPAPKPQAETEEPLHGSREWRAREAKRRSEG